MKLSNPVGLSIIICVNIFVVGMSYLSILGNGLASEPFEINTLTPSVYPNGKIQILVAITTNAVLGTKWQVFLDTDKPVCSGVVLTNQFAVEFREHAIKSSGKYSLLLIADQNTDRQRVIKGSEIEIKETYWRPFQLSLLGSLVTIIIAVGAFCFKEVIVRRKRRTQLAIQLRIILETLDDYASGRSPGWVLPNWVTCDSYGEWSEMLFEEPFRGITHSLRDIAKKIRLQHVDKSELKTEVGRLRDTLLKKPRRSTSG